MAPVAAILPEYGSRAVCLWQLDWRRDLSREGNIEPTYRAPSWSWAAVNGLITSPNSYWMNDSVRFPTILFLEISSWTDPLDYDEKLPPPRWYARVQSSLYKGIVWKRHSDVDPS